MFFCAFALINQCTGKDEMVSRALDCLDFIKVSCNSFVSEFVNAWVQKHNKQQTHNKYLSE